MALFDDDTTRAMVQTVGGNNTGAYTPSGGGAATTIDVDFRNAHEAAVLLDVSIQDSKPVAFVVTSDLTGTIKGGTLLVDGTTYEIVAPPQPDGEDMTMLVLSEDTP